MLYFVSAPAKPFFKAEVRNASTISVEILYPKTYPESIEGGQPDQFMVVYELSELATRNDCTLGKLN